MQKQHLEVVQRLLCWRVHFCNIPTEHKRLKQHHILPAYFGTCCFLNCCSLGATALRTAETITFPDMPQLNSNTLKSASPDALLRNMAVVLWLVLWKWVTGWKASVRCCMGGHLYMALSVYMVLSVHFTLLHCLSQSFSLQVLANLFCLYLH